MKKYLLLAGMLSLAAPAYAYVQPGQLTPGVTPTPSTSGPQEFNGLGYQGEDVIVPNASSVPVTDDPQDPSPAVPEPGTMTLASMGLLAMGAAIRRRRNKQ